MTNEPLVELSATREPANDTPNNEQPQTQAGTAAPQRAATPLEAVKLVSQSGGTLTLDMSEEETPALVKQVMPQTAAASKRQAGGFDFIRAYVSYADVLEAPPEAHEIVATQLLATALNRDVYIQHGATKVPLDLWTLILSGSGFGRNTLVGLARPILDGAGLNHLILNSTWGSIQAFYQSIAERPSGLFVWPELSIILKKFQEPRFGGVKEWLTNCYDNHDIPEATCYRRTGKASDTPPITFSCAPRLNVLGTSSLDWFFSNLNQEDALGGFVPRWVFRKMNNSDRVIPIPRKPDSALIDPLAQHIRQVSKLTGEAVLSDAAEKAYDGWYRKAKKRFSEQPNSALAMTFFNRLRTHVLKLGVTFEISRTLSLKVSPHAMGRAIKTAMESERTIFALLPTGMHREGAEVDKMTECIRKAGAEGMLRSEFTKAFQHIKAHDRESRLQTLRLAGTIYAFWRDTSGRKGMALVHAAYRDQYVAGHPRDEDTQ